MRIGLTLKPEADGSFRWLQRNETAVPHSVNKHLNLTKLCEKLPAFFITGMEKENPVSSPALTGGEALIALRRVRPLR